MMMDKLTLSIRPLPEGTRFASLPILLATWFGAGRIKPASGTMGTLAAVPFGFAISYVGQTSLWLLPAAIVLFFAGVYAANYYGSKSGKQDDQAIVIDEAVGVFIAAIPAETVPILWILAFILFRFFDIYKPWPASYFEERKKGGFDVMMDDVIAGLFAMFGVASVSLLLT